jgi:hypothetical protein
MAKNRSSGLLGTEAEFTKNKVRYYSLICPIITKHQQSP